MNIDILSRGPKLYSTKRLVEAAESRGHTVHVRDALEYSIFVEEEEPQLFYENEAIELPDAIIPRIGASITFFGTAIVRQFEQMGVFNLNSSAAISVSRDKLRSMQILSRHDIGLPATAFVRGKADILPAIERVGGVPVIIKLLEGTQGVGVILADNIKIAEAIIETLHGANQNVLIQKFVAESKGKDIRALVVGGKVVAAMRRRAVGEEFRSNVHRGGKTEPVQLDPEFERTAVLATQIMGLRVAGVDMLEGADGPQVLEINSSPGLEGIEGATKVDVAGAIIEHLEEGAAFPDIDLRQRLTLARGYGVAELPVPPTSPLANQNIEKSFADSEIRVMSIDRQGLTMPSPGGDTEVLPGDVLLCYGKLLAIKALRPAGPHQVPKRKKKKKKASPA